MVGSQSDYFPITMQNKFLPVLVAATLFTCGARAQDATATTPVQTPQPMTPPTAQVAPTAPIAQAAPAQTAPTPNQIIYSPRLPTPAELTSVASAQGMTIEQISQTSNQVTVIYRLANGQANTVAYQLLPTSTAPAPTTVVVPSQAPTVVYQTQSPTVIYQTVPSTVYYYDTYTPYYYPRYYYPPASIHLGFGYYRGWGGGYYGHHWR